MSHLALAARAFLCAAVLAPSAVAAPAQTFPSKPIRLILPYVPGGIIDNVGRNLAQRLSETMGQSVVAENRPGAGGMVGTDVVARAAPDGYTDPVDRPGGRHQSDAAEGRPLRSLQAADGLDHRLVAGGDRRPRCTRRSRPSPSSIAYAKANPGKLNFASAGIGTAPHLAGELVKLRAGIEMTHVPYRGIGASYPDVMSGKVQLAFSSIAGAVPFTADNRVRAIATTAAVRNKVYPDVPTVAETLPGFDVDLWTGIFAPAGLPPAVLARLNGEINKALAHPEHEGGAREDRRRAARHQPEESAAFTRAEYEKWKKVIAEGNIKSE